ncbi:12016_t:CDS:1, partial [Dentiscutata heterogama]
TALLYAHRSARISISTLADVGKYVVEVAKNHEKFETIVRISSITLTLSELLKKFR